MTELLIKKLFFANDISLYYSNYNAELVAEQMKLALYH